MVFVHGVGLAFVAFAVAEESPEEFHVCLIRNVTLLGICQNDFSVEVD